MAMTIKPVMHDDGAAAAPEPAGMAFPVRLEALFAQWLTDRARAFGEPPEEHAARILRQFWAQHDDWRHAQAEAAGLSGTTRRTV